MNFNDARVSQFRRLTGDVFTRSQAIGVGIRPHEIYSMRDSGDLIALGGGHFRWAAAGPIDLDLLEIAQRVPQATLCLESALAHHALSDAIPSIIDIAIPRGKHRPKLNAPIRLHYFDSRTFEIGRDQIDVGAMFPLGLFSPERSVIDAIRLRHQEGSDQAWEALRRYLKIPGAMPSRLIRMARHFFGVEARIRAALEIIQ